jgi:hypothetical protein
MKRMHAKYDNHEKRLKFVAICAWLATLMVSLTYTAYFHSALVDGDWTDIRGFTRIVIPDTFVYKSLIEEGFSIFSIVIAGVKNAIGPALVWIISFSNWFVVVVFNSLLLLALLFYVIKLCHHFQVPRARAQFIVLTIGLMPTMTYFSIGALKELPTLLAITAFYFHFVRQQTMRWMLMVLILLLFRYQLIAVLTIFYLIDKYSKNPLRISLILLLAISMAYPLFEKANILSSETTALYREDSGSSTGALIEGVRSSVPVASAVAISIRVMQSILEPLVPAPGTYWFFEGESFSMLALAYIASLLLMLPFWWRTVSTSYQIIKKTTPISRDLASLYSLVFLFVIFVGGFSFVHHRYLFPITALVMIGGAAQNRRIPAGIDRLSRARVHVNPFKL